MLAVDVSRKLELGMPTLRPEHARYNVEYTLAQFGVVEANDLLVRKACQSAEARSALALHQIVSPQRSPILLRGSSIDIQR